MRIFLGSLGAKRGYSNIGALSFDCRKTSMIKFATQTTSTAKSSMFTSIMLPPFFGCYALQVGIDIFSIFKVELSSSSFENKAQAAEHLNRWVAVKAFTPNQV